MKLDDLQPNAAVRGILPDALVTVVNVQWFGSEALELTYKDPTGRVYAICERKKRAQEALAYNGLVQSWLEITRLAREGVSPGGEQDALFGEK